MAKARIRTSPAGSNAGIGHDRANCRAASEAGFSLVEILVVTAILAMAAVITTTSLTRSSGKQLKPAIQLIAAKLRKTRATAIALRRQQRVYFDVKARKVWTDIQDGTIQLDDQTRIWATVATGERASPAVFGIAFYPDGSASGATLRLSTTSQTHEVRINWLTGRVTTKSLQ